MARRALLICCPNPPGLTALPGAQIDFENYDHYLRSRVGGAWTDQEIIPLVDEQRQTVLDTIHSCDNMDYVFVLFSGHGSHPASNPNPRASQVRLTGTMTVDHLDPGNGRCTIFVDSCRTPGVVAARTAQYLNENNAMLPRAPARPPLADYRDAFNRAVARCPEQSAYLFGCSVGQTAIDNAVRGGLFPEAMRSRAIAWERNRYSAFNATESIFSVFFWASLRVIRDTGHQQSPRFHRTITDGMQVPFAVYRTV